jgi:hypothetical protein
MAALRLEWRAPVTILNGHQDDPSNVWFARDKHSPRG